MNKSNSKVLLMLACFILGVGTGILSYWYFGFKAPANKAMAIAKARQEQMNKAVRSGKLVSIGDDGIVVSVERSGDPDLVGKEVLFKIEPDTTIQQGLEIIVPKQKGEKVDLGKYISPGKEVNVLARALDGADGNKLEGAVAIHWSTGHTPLEAQGTPD